MANVNLQSADPVQQSMSNFFTLLGCLRSFISEQAIFTLLIQTDTISGTPLAFNHA